MLDDTNTLKRKLDSISTNIAIYKNDLEKHKKKLRKHYGIDDPSDIPKAVRKLEEEIRSLSKKKKKYLRKASKILKDISND